MTCKDCICSEVCYYKAFNDEKHLKKRRDDVDKICKSFVHRDSLKNAPTVDAVEVVHGRWVKHEPKPEAMREWHRQGIGKAMSEASIFWTCSCCEAWGPPRYNFCPNCGAKMDGGNEDG